MKAIIRLTAPLLCLCLLPCAALSQKKTKSYIDAIKEHAQKPSKTDAKPDKSGKVTLAMLKSATKITYGFGNGAVHPDYAYTGDIIVTPKNVTLTIYHDSSESYSNSVAISSTQYATFLNHLYSIGLKPNPDDPMMLCGGSPLTIKIQKGNQTLFAGTILEEIVTTKGFLGDPFVALLPDYMKEVFDNPGSTFAPNLDPFDPFASDLP